MNRSRTCEDNLRPVHEFPFYENENLAMTKTFQGIITPLLTPLKDWRTLDVHGLGNVVSRLLCGGVHGLFVLGTTGEGPSLSYDLRREIIDRVLKLVDGAVPVLASVTDTSLVESLRLAQFSAEKGCKALVVSAPYYHPISQEDLTRYLAKLGELSPLPLFLYNIPSHTKIRFEVETLKIAFENPKYIGLKDSSGDLDYFFKVAKMMKPRTDLSLFIGQEHLLVPAMKLGADGGICGGAHILPRLFVKLYDAVRSGELESVEVLEHRLVALGTLYNGFAEASFLCNMKGVLELLGICHGALAEPLHALSRERIDYIRCCLQDLGITAETLE